ncbi:TPPP family protein CG45057-like [Fopius arisanus]|uniref:TPPP family protein CG45057-like n=1 Tax=Fopius arisanus TaxID=64838 RepID=A0A9R1TCB9_9HYME|nr:PREDICTED: TPPP family protein CG45057-like [Fopius arisanus]
MNIMELKPRLSREDTPDVLSLKEMFEAYCHLDPVSDAMGVKHLPFSQLSIWLESAKIIDMNRVTKTDAYVCFFKFEKRAINYEEFLLYLEDLAKERHVDLKEMKQKLKSCGKPKGKDHLPKRETSNKI